MPENQEIVLDGIAASPGIMIGPCYVYSEPSWEPEPRVIPPSETSSQIELFRKSVNSVLDNLRRSYKQTRAQYGVALAEILELQIALLEDRIFLAEVEEHITQKHFDAAYATFVIFRRKKELFLQMENEYFRDRAFDIQALKQQLLRKILNRGTSALLDIQDAAVLIADNLSPSDTVHLHERKVLGFATNAGGRTSHTAIVARSLNVPAVVGLKSITNSVNPGDVVILDGLQGKVILCPDKKTITRYEQHRQAYLSFEQLLLQQSAADAQTADGKRIYIQSNVEFETELDRIKEVAADGIGLFRTEGIFLSRDDLPSEAEQAKIYRNIADSVYPNTVIIRTLDIGGDKMLPSITNYFNYKEENPFLGWRAIRFWLDHQAGFLAQLKAIFRANHRGNVKVMVPMVSSIEEIHEVKSLLDEAERELALAGEGQFPAPDLGIMIEIPAAVVMAEEFAREVDFLSIGTNDLVQYTLAVDRGNEKVAKLYSHYHPAVLRMVKQTIEAGHRANVPVSMCGEMAADPMAVPLLIAMGLEYFSASYYAIPRLKKIVRELSLAECSELNKRVAELHRTDEIVATVQAFFRKKFPDLTFRK